MKVSCDCNTFKRENYIKKELDGIEYWFCKGCFSYLRDPFGYLVDAELEIRNIEGE